MMVGILVQIGTALRAQTPAIRSAQWLQRQRFDQRVADHRLDVRECAVLQQRIRVFRLVLAGDDVDFVVLLALAALAVGLVLTRLVREEHRHINRPVLVNRLQAARALADEWRDQAAGEDQAVHNRIELPAHVYGLTFLDADNAVANAGRCREIGVNRLGLTGARSNLRYRNGPRGIFNSCHGMFLVPFVCWLELFVTGVISRY